MLMSLSFYFASQYVWPFQKKSHDTVNGPGVLVSNSNGPKIGPTINYAETLSNFVLTKQKKQKYTKFSINGVEI